VEDIDVTHPLKEGTLSRQRLHAGPIFSMVIALVLALVALLKLPIWVSWTGIIPAAALVFFVGKSMNSDVHLDRERAEEASSRVRTAATQVAALRTKEEDASAPERDRLELAELWLATQGKIEQDRQFVLRQARLYSNASLGAMVIGLFMMAAFIVYAVRAHTASAEIAAGISVVAAALTSYLGKTFMKSQETTASYLQGYFATQLDFFRLLAAERLVEKSSQATDVEGAKLLRSIAQDLGAPNDKRHSAKDKKRKS
jgi:hypothetical protein